MPCWRCPSSTSARPPPPDLLRTVEADLAATSHDIPIPLNDRVLRYVELFQGRLRDFLTEGLNRGTAYLPMIQSVLRVPRACRSTWPTSRWSRARSSRPPCRRPRPAAPGSSCRARPPKTACAPTGTSTSGPTPTRRPAPPPSTSRRSTRCSATGTWRWRRTTAAPAACSARSSAASSTTSGRSARRRSTCRARRASTCR